MCVIDKYQKRIPTKLSCLYRLPKIRQFFLIKFILDPLYESFSLKQLKTIFKYTIDNTDIETILKKEGWIV